MALRWKGNTKLKILLVIVVLLVGFRLTLPYFVTRYVNKVLSELEGYRGQIYDVDIHLIRGAYQIDSLKVFKIDGNNEIPFIDIPLMDLSVEWNSLFKGKVVGEIKFDDPKLNFIIGKKTEGEGSGEQTGEDVDWTKPIKKLMPLQINKLTIKEGSVVFYDFTTKPKVDLSLNNVYLIAENLNNAKEQNDLLPSKVFMRATSIGGGNLEMHMRINVLKEMPDLDMDVKFENVDMTALNDFFEAYARIDVEKGDFNLYSELAVKEGNINGYVKPLFNNLKVVDWKSDKDKPARLVWESIAGVLVELFENQPENQFATRVPLRGNISNVDAPFWPTLWNIFRNAFVEAFAKNTDDTITISTATSQGKEKSKKDIRKEKRERKKTERKERRAARREKRKADPSQP
jgi:hypothetical protein